MTVHNSPSAAASAQASSLMAYWVLFVIFLANFLSTIDRVIVSMIVEPLKADLGLTDSSIGLLTGFAFVTFYSVFGLGFARWADKGVRRNILAFGLSLWSLATAACGLATNLWQMAMARMAVGVGEASGTPTSLSLIGDYFGKADRPQALAVFRASSVAGALIGIPATGWITDEFGWRATFFFFGAMGLPLALLILFTVPEPQRGSLDSDAATAPPPLPASLGVMWAHRPFVLMLLGLALFGISEHVGGAWVPALLMRVHDLSATEVGALLGTVIATSGLVGTLVGGALASFLMRRGHSDRAVMALLLVSALLGVPMQMIFLFHESLVWCLAGGAAAAFLGALKLGPFLALLMNWMPVSIRALTAAMWVLATSLVPGGVGPLAVGLMSDALHGHGPAQALRYAMGLQPITLLMGTLVCGAAILLLPKTAAAPKFYPAASGVGGLMGASQNSDRVR